jgi:hypothetical protein
VRAATERALLYLDRRFAEHVLDSWERGESSLLEPVATLP